MGAAEWRVLCVTNGFYPVDQTTIDEVIRVLKERVHQAGVLEGLVTDREPLWSAERDTREAS